MKITTITISLFSLLLSGCAVPVIVGGAAATAGMAVKDKGVSGSINDSSITTAISTKLYRKSSKAFTQIDTDVYMGEVLFTGICDDPSYAKQAEELAWAQDGVLMVYNHIENNQEASLLDYTKDSWLTTKIKSKFIGNKKIHSMNYFVKTVGGIVYIMGIARDEKEMKAVHNLASNTDGVKKVVSYVKQKGID